MPRTPWHWHKSTQFLNSIVQKDGRHLGHWGGGGYTSSHMPLLSWGSRPDMPLASGSQKIVYREWPEKGFPTVNFVLSHDGPFGLGGGPPPPYGLGGCIGMPLVNSTGYSPISGTADPRSSQTGQVMRGLR